MYRKNKIIIERKQQPDTLIFRKHAFTISFRGNLRCDVRMINEFLGLSVRRIHFDSHLASCQPSRHNVISQRSY